jgi:hypothetical protein
MDEKGHAHSVVVGTLEARDRARRPDVKAEGKQHNTKMDLLENGYEGAD